MRLRQRTTSKKSATLSPSWGSCKLKKRCLDHAPRTGSDTSRPAGNETTVRTSQSQGPGAAKSSIAAGATPRKEVIGGGVVVAVIALVVMRQGCSSTENTPKAGQGTHLAPAAQGSGQ